MGQDSSKPIKARLSLSKKDQQSKAGIELISICQTITEDGSLSDAEIISLKSWLEENSKIEMPSIGYLIDVINIIIEDRIITDQERKELHSAIEKVLPPDIRYLSINKRKEIERDAKLQKKIEQEKAKEEERLRRIEERRKLTPVCRAGFMVAGVRYEDRPDIVRLFVKGNDKILLVRDRENKFSKNAIEVRIENGMQIGFVPEIFAKELATNLDNGLPYIAFVNKILDRAKPPIPVVVAEIYSMDTTQEGVVYDKGNSGNQNKLNQNQGCGCLGILLLVGMLWK